MSDEQNPPAEMPAEPASSPVAPAEAESAHTPVYEPIPETQNEAISAPKSEPAQPLPEEPQEAAPTAQNAMRASRDLLVQARAKRLTLRQEHLGAIMSEIEKSGSLSNKDIKKLFDCSEASATRYLSALVKAGKIKREGRGRGVVYVRV